MPSYLDFNSTKHFRDFILNKTLTVPNGPQSFTAENYIVNSTGDMVNKDLGTVDTNRTNDLLQSQKSNLYKPTEYFITENINTAPRKANLSLYPYFVNRDYRSLVSVMSTSNYDSESELMRFAAWNIRQNPEGPILSRVAQNLYSATVGRVRLIDALQGNIATATNIITGREPLVESNPKITVARTATGKAIDFLQTVGGVEFPWVEIPGDYLSNPRNPSGGNVRPEARTEIGRVIQDATGVLGSLLGIQRRPTTTKKPSDLFIEYMGQRQKSILFDNLSYSKYAPDYTTTARSQNTSKIFNFIDNTTQSVKNFLGLEAPKGVAYIGDDRGNDVKFAMNDFNDRPVKSSHYLSLMFDEVQAKLFQRTKNIVEGGGIAGKLTWISTKSRNKLGANNLEFPDERSQFDPSLSTEFNFRSDSILGLTQEILETMPTDGGAARSHVANVIDQTSRVFREGDIMLSRGSAIKYVNQFTQQESGVEYCRVWTKDRSYMNYSDTMKRSGNVRKFESSILDKPWNLNIYPNSNGSTNIVERGDGFYAKKYMFSIENLAWKTSNTPGFTYFDLPYCERGSNNGRIMWFPPYDLKISEQSNASWESNKFLGRPEPIYTYQNTERMGQVSFKVIVDHPSILNLLVREHFEGMSDEEADNYINAFFAGCEEIDFYGLIRRYTTLTPNEVETVKKYLNENKDKETVKTYKTVFTPVISDTPTPKNEPEEISISAGLRFKNNYPQIGSDDLKSTLRFDELYDGYIAYYDGGGYLIDLNKGLNILRNSSTWGNNQKQDFRVLYGIESTFTKPPDSVFVDGNVEVVNAINKGFDLFKNDFESIDNQLSLIKSKLEKNEIDNVSLLIRSSTSSIADEHYNLKLSYRRSYSIIWYIVNRLGLNQTTIDNAMGMVQWRNKPNPTDVQSKEPPIIIPFKTLGYDIDGDLQIQYIENIGKQSFEDSGEINVKCTEENRILTSSELKMTAPVTFYCRTTFIVLKYKARFPDTEPIKPPVVVASLVEDTDVPSGNVPAPPIDEIKRIIMKTLSECYYFKKLEEDSPVQFSSLKEKLRYFHPAFHSMTPEGLNTRLTFLQQCVRPGDTLPIKGLSDESDLNARNTTFGPPPICVLRIGDFYHSKIIIRDVNITFDDNVWDLNPEGIGVQPMIANVSLQISFIGGHGLERPVERLQNALSSNFYANTEMYDPRAIATEDRKSFYEQNFKVEDIEFMNKRDAGNVVANENDFITATNKIKEGEYIGEFVDDFLDYTDLVDGHDEKLGVYSQTENYTKTYINGYNSIIAKYGTNIGSMLLHPNYRTIKDYIVQTGAGTETIQLLGNYRKGYELPVLVDSFKLVMSGKTLTENISTLMGFNKDLPNSVLVKSEEILKPKVMELILSEIDNIDQSVTKKIEIERNKLISVLDKLNFIVETSGHDGKIENNEFTSYDFIGYTYDKLYGEYSNVINFLKDNQNKFIDDLDTSYFYGEITIPTEQYSICLSVLLRDKREEIMKIYTRDPIFTPQIQKSIERRLNAFLLPPTQTSTDTSPKNFRIKKYPVRKNNTKIMFELTDQEYIFNENQKTNLINTLRTSGNNTTTVLNYYRDIRT